MKATEELAANIRRKPLVTAVEFAMMQGFRAFIAGEPPPPHNPDASPCGPAEHRWIGYMLARAEQQRDQRRVRELLGVPETEGKPDDT